MNSQLTQSVPQVATGLAPEPLLVDAAGLAVLLGCSRRHVQAMDSSGRLGPRSIALGRSRRWSVDEVRRWIALGCPSRGAWLARQQGGSR